MSLEPLILQPAFGSEGCPSRFPKPTSGGPSTFPMAASSSLPPVPVGRPLPVGALGSRARTATPGVQVGDKSGKKACRGERDKICRVPVQGLALVALRQDQDQAIRQGNSEQ